MYQYFIQQIINKYNKSVVGYELLLRKKTDADWRPVHDFLTVPSNVVAYEIVKVSEQLYSKVPFLSVNLNRTQLMNPQTVEAILKIQTILRPVQIQIELTEDESTINFSEDDIIKQLKKFIKEGMSISIDDVDCGCNTEDHVRALIPYTNEIKFALQNFGESVYLPEIQKRVIFWRDFAKTHKIRFILEGIENEKIDQFIDLFNIDIRQGYYYEKPHPIQLDANR